MTKEKENKNCGPISAGFRWFLLFFIPFIIFTIGLLPTIFVLIFLRVYVPQSTILYLIIVPVIIAIEIFIFLVGEILISGVIIRIFNIKYEEGTYDYNVRDKNAFKWILFCSLYTPVRKILEIIPMGYIRNIYLRLVGMKIGKNTLVGGVIKDPCMTEFKDNVTMGEYSCAYAHIQDMKKETITIKKISVGNDCIIGAGAFLMPGVKMESGSIIAAGGIVPKNTVLKKDKIYGGNPAKEIKKKKS